MCPGERELQEAPERERDLVSQVVPDPPQRWDNWLIPEWRSLAERYASGEVEIHVRFGGSFGGHPVSEFLAVVHRPANAYSGLIDGWEVSAEKLVGRRGDDGEVDPVLVHSAQFVDGPEGVLPELVPTLVRLQLLNDDLRTGGHMPVGMDGGSEAGLAVRWLASLVDVSEDRERGSGLVFGGERGPLMCVGIALRVEGKGQVVEGAAESVDGVPDQIGPVIRNAVDPGDVCGPPCLRISLFDNAVGVAVEPALDVAVQGI